MRKRSSCYGIRKREKQILIGIMGIHRGDGATTMAVATGNYISGVSGCKVCITECNEHKDFYRIYDACYDSVSLAEPDGTFEIEGVTYIPKGGQKGLNPLVFSKDYQVAVIDFGTDIEKNMYEYSRCDYKILVGSAAMWRYEEYCVFCQKFEKFLAETDVVHIIEADSKDIGFLKKKFKKKIVKRPQISNPYGITKENIEFFSWLFREDKWQ